MFLLVFMPFSKIMSNADIIDNYLDAIEYSDKYSNCKKLSVGAVLVSKTWLFYGINGGQNINCKEGDSDNCRREYGVDELEQYRTCRSFCAEGDVLLSAEKNYKYFENCALITTLFPCSRCTKYIISSALTSGLKEIYFGAYKSDDGKARLQDEFYADLLIDAGISVNQIEYTGNGVYNIKFIERSKNDWDYYDEEGIALPKRWYFLQILCLITV